MHRLVGPEPHHHRLGADRQRAGEHVVALDRLLQVHEHLPAGVVRGVKFGRVADPRDAAPGAAVVWLHEQRVADARRDRVEVERPVVPRGRVHVAGVVDGILVRHQHRLGHLEAKPHHRAVRRVLLHRLERERAVEQVHVVHEGDLLQPLPGVVVPVGEPVDRQVVARPVAQAERLDGDALAAEGVRRAAGAGHRTQAAQYLLERARTVFLGAEQQPDQVSRGGQGGPPRWWVAGGDHPHILHATRRDDNAARWRGPRGHATVYAVIGCPLAERGRMGRDIQPIKISGEDRRKYREKLRRSLDVFDRMLREKVFADHESLVGQEIELNLVDDDGWPSMRNADVLAAIANPAWATELGQFNIEINVPPRRLDGDAFAELEEEVRADLNAADAKARGSGSHLVMIGILPTLRQQDLHEGILSANARYRVLNEQIFAARGEDMRIAIDGAEQLVTHADSITPEAACTSVQLHLQVSPDEFANYWNAAQAICGVQVALAANSPFLFGRQLWHETRITLFEQATDTRPEELKQQGVRPRVWFGERWITSVFDLF